MLIAFRSSFLCNRKEFLATDLKKIEENSIFEFFENFFSLAVQIELQIASIERAEFSCSFGSVAFHFLTAIFQHASKNFVCVTKLNFVFLGEI
jgi:hypothetical protein